jgi:hypothetical protein
MESNKEARGSGYGIMEVNTMYQQVLGKGIDYVNEHLVLGIGIWSQYKLEFKNNLIRQQCREGRVTLYVFNFNMSKIIYIKENRTPWSTMKEELPSPFSYYKQHLMDTKAAKSG